MPFTASSPLSSSAQGNPETDGERLLIVVPEAARHSRVATQVLEREPPAREVASDLRRHVVLAEDDEDFRNLLATSIRQQGYRVTECKHGAELCEVLDCAIQRKTPLDVDLVITDVRMPGFTGLEILEGVKQLNPDVPFIIITAFGDADTHEEAKTLGAVQVIDKPFDVYDMLAIVNRTLTPAPI